MNKRTTITTRDNVPCEQGYDPMDDPSSCIMDSSLCYNTPSDSLESLLQPSTFHHTTLLDPSRPTIKESIPTDYPLYAPPPPPSFTHESMEWMDQNIMSSFSPMHSPMDPFNPPFHHPQRLSNMHMPPHYHLVSQPSWPPMMKQYPVYMRKPTQHVVFQSKPMDYTTYSLQVSDHPHVLSEHQRILQDQQLLSQDPPPRPLDDTRRVLQETVPIPSALCTPAPTPSPPALHTLSHPNNDIQTTHKKPPLTINTDQRFLSRSPESLSAPLYPSPSPAFSFSPFHSPSSCHFPLDKSYSSLIEPSIQDAHEQDQKKRRRQSSQETSFTDENRPDFVGHLDQNVSSRRSYPCMIPGCNKSYTTGAGLRYHLHNIHNSPSPRFMNRPAVVYGCNMCSKSYVTRSGLKYHKIRANHFQPDEDQYSFQAVTPK